MTPRLLDAARRALTTVLGTDLRIETATGLGGGCINQVYRLETSGGPFLLKANDAAPDGMFSAEAMGLAELRAVDSTLVVPEVIAVQDEPTRPRFLILEFLTPGPRTADFNERLGQGLAQLHAATSASGEFGFGRDNFCGATPQPNPWTETWGEFYAEHRIRHQVELASAQRKLQRTERIQCERLIARLPALIDSSESPALIHGDLWSGNLHRTPDGQPALIDPAPYYAHREAEFGMMLLFGGFSDRVIAAYEATSPLAHDWRERVGLYQLYHLLNHLNLFGRSYAGQVMDVVQRYAGARR